MMIEVLILPTGDTADAESPEAALVAARTLLTEAADEHQYRSARAAFYVEGKLVRSDVSLADLTYGVLQ